MASHRTQRDPGAPDRSSIRSALDRLETARFRPRLLDSLKGYDATAFGRDLGAGFTVDRLAPVVERVAHGVGHRRVRHARVGEERGGAEPDTVRGVPLVEDRTVDVAPQPRGDRGRRGRGGLAAL